MDKPKIEFKSKDDFKPPFLCRYFGHKWRETIYEVMKFPGFSSSLEVCARKNCGCGRHIGIFGYGYSLPKHVNEFIRKEQLKPVEEATVTNIHDTSSSANTGPSQ